MFQIHLKNIYAYIERTIKCTLICVILNFVKKKIEYFQEIKNFIQKLL
jgi:hypothetical protein